MDTTGIDSLRYLAGRPLDIMEHHYEPGDTVPPSVVALIPYVEAFTRSGHLFLLHPEKGYEQLPPHLYNVVMTKSEAKQALKPAPPIITPATEKAAERHAADPVVALAEAESIVRVNHKDPELGAKAERHLFEKGVSTVKPADSDKRAAETVKAQKDGFEALKKERESDQGTVDAVAPQAEPKTGEDNSKPEAVKPAPRKTTAAKKD